MIAAIVWDLRERVRTQIPPKEGHLTGRGPVLAPSLSSPTTMQVLEPRVFDNDAVMH